MAEIPQQPAQVQPFDLGAPPADLPFGSTNLPNTSSTMPSIEELQQQQERLIAEGPYARPDFQVLPAAQQEVVVAWWPHIWMKQSEYLDGKFVTTIPGLLMHAEAAQKDYKKKQREQEKADAVTRRENKEQREQRDVEFSEHFLAWQNECAQRKAWVEAKCAEWRKRVAMKKEAMLQWETYVEEARLDYQNAKATPVPPRPQR